MSTHNDYEKFLAFKPHLTELQKLATQHGIDDIFQDNGGKLLEVLLLRNLKGIPGRAGNDATDETGQEYEVKTMNLLKVSHFSTHHHMNPRIIKKYRAAKWLFGIYRNIELLSVYEVPVNGLDEKFTKWERTIESRLARGVPPDMNNPTISAKLVQKLGKLVEGKHYFELRRTIKIIKKKKVAPDNQLKLGLE